MKPLQETEIVFLSAVRTPFGAQNKSLKGLTATDLGVVVAEAAMEKAQIQPEDVGHVVFGNVLQTSSDAIYLPRHIALRSGMKVETPAVGVNRLCGSGFESIVQGAQRILLGETDVVLAGGTESMSQAPFVLRGVRDGIRFSQEPKLRDSLWEALYDPVADMPMAMTAEKLGEQYGVTREDCDEYAHRSQQAYKKALEAGLFDDEIVPVEIKSRRGTVLVEQDEHPRPDATLEAMRSLPAYFKEGGLVSAGNASGIVDGAAAVVLARADWAQENGLEAIGRLLGWGVAGCDPTIMGIGPAPASRRALEATGLTLNDIDLVEINEAFAPQYLAVERELKLDREKTNVNGGAIAVGHPLGATGTRLTGHMLHELGRRDGGKALVSACIGGGQGLTLILER